MNHYTGKFQELQSNFLMQVGRLTLPEQGVVFALVVARWLPAFQHFCSHKDDVSKPDELHTLVHQLIEAYSYIKEIPKEDILKWRKQIEDLTPHAYDFKYAPVAIELCILLDVSADFLMQVNYPPYTSRFESCGLCWPFDMIVMFIGMRDLGCSEPGDERSDFAGHFCRSIMNAPDFQTELGILNWIIRSVREATSEGAENPNYLQIRQDIENVPWTHLFEI